ncbi:transposase [Streptomyces sp. NBC_00286]|uniref:transposase n=1 Tax=Streptomyces sp. NBC_00286 TaxID=2975701 RepID=UPI003FA6933B
MTSSSVEGKQVIFRATVGAGRRNLASGPAAKGYLRRRPPPRTDQLPDWKEEHNRSHKQVRARVEHTFARMKDWKILRDGRLKGDGVHHAILGIARLHELR